MTSTLNSSSSGNARKMRNSPRPKSREYAARGSSVPCCTEASLFGQSAPMGAKMGSVPLVAFQACADVIDTHAHSVRRQMTCDAGRPFSPKLTVVVGPSGWHDAHVLLCPGRLPSQEWW